MSAIPHIHVPNQPLQLLASNLASLYHLLPVFGNILARADVVVEAEPELGGTRRQERVRKEEIRDDGRGSV
jgi:hypothetical protein